MRRVNLKGYFSVLGPKGVYLEVMQFAKLIRERDANKEPKGDSGSEKYKIKISLIVEMTKDTGELECPIGFPQAARGRNMENMQAKKL